MYAVVVEVQSVCCVLYNMRRARRAKVNVRGDNDSYHVIVKQVSLTEVQQQPPATRGGPSGVGVLLWRM